MAGAAAIRRRQGRDVRRLIHGRHAMARRDTSAAEPQGDGAVDHGERLSQRLDLPGRGVRAVLQCELDDDLAWARKADTRARRKSGGERRTRHRDGIDRPYVRPDGFHAAAGVPNVPLGRTLFLRLARASLLRRLLAQALYRGVPRQNRGADAEYRGMVRHLPGWNDPKPPGDARPWRVGGGPQFAPDAGPVESWLAASEPGWAGRYGLSFEPGLRRPRRLATGL